MRGVVAGCGRGDRDGRRRRMDAHRTTRSRRRRPDRRRRDRPRPRSRRPGVVRGQPHRAGRARARVGDGPHPFARLVAPRRDARATARRCRRRRRAARSRRDVHRGRDARQREPGARDGDRLREGTGAVRPADRQLPGGQAPLRRHARRRRGHALDGLLGRLVHRCTTTPTRRSRRRPRRPGAPTRRSG